MYHNLMMIKFTALVCATVLIFGCAEDKEISPSFPEIKNPLDDSNEKQNALELATEVDQLVFSEESGLNIYRSKDGDLYNGWVKKTYDDGKVGYLFHCLNGIEDGLHTAWYRNGNKLIERTWKQGLRHGPYQQWTDFGVLKSRGYHKNNLLDGLNEEFYADGKKKSEIVYAGGKIVTFKKWKEDGTPCPLTNVENGSGIVVHYRDDGSFDYNESYYQGEIDYGISMESNDSELGILESSDENIESNFSIIPTAEETIPEQNNSE